MGWTQLFKTRAGRTGLGRAGELEATAAAAAELVQLYFASIDKGDF